VERLSDGRWTESVEIDVGGGSEDGDCDAAALRKVLVIIAIACTSIAPAFQPSSFK
jgi:hypothetical protein